MRLRNQLLALSLVTLLLPFSGLLLVQELENFLREAEETTLLSSAQTIRQVLPQEYLEELKLARGQILPLRQLDDEPILDGYISEWPEPGQHAIFEATGGRLSLAVLAGRFANDFYLALKVTDPGDIKATTFNAGATDASNRAGVQLYVQSKRGQFSYMISTEAPGALLVNSQGGKGTQLSAAWMDDGDGYTLELNLPGDIERISVGAVAPAFTMQGVSGERYAGTLRGRQQGEWLELISRDDGLAHWLAGARPGNARTWLVQADGWVVADSGPELAPEPTELTWVERLIYQAVADSDMPPREQEAPWPVRFRMDVVDRALAGEQGTFWRRDVDSAAVYNLVAVPVFADGPGDEEIIGAILMEARSEGLLLMTNRALGRVSTVALLPVVVLVVALLLFASYLSGRVKRLSSAVGRAMDSREGEQELPLTDSSDELGDLARNTRKLLKAVADYNAYLQKLAGRLSHELKTPIAITRSSLENLDSSPLDPQARQYLERAREGLDRQAAIVSAMSEAQRLEGAVKTADWETIDLAEMLGYCVQGYRSVHPARSIELDIPPGGLTLRCAPELIAQALDKLVDNAVSLSADDCEIRLSASCADGHAHITVANTGSRLPDVLSEQLFDSLVSLRQQRGSGRHLGLGLYIVRLVAEAHGGRASAANLPDDGGVEFSISLPLES
jgi:dedicated sortase system histidine kinase